MKNLLVLVVLALGLYYGLRWAGCVAGGQQRGGEEPERGAPAAAALENGPDVAAPGERAEEHPAEADRPPLEELARAVLGGDADRARALAARCGEEGRRLLDAFGEEPVSRWLGWSRLLESGRVAREQELAYLDELEQRARSALRTEQLSLRVRVEPGDSLSRITRRLRREQGLRVAVGVVRWLNGLRGDLIRPGQRLWVPKIPWSLEASQKGFWLRVLAGEGIVRQFRIGVGRDGKTPTGSFPLKAPLEHPPWKNPETGKIVLYGDPGYAIGTRWIGFGGEGEALGLGIHGTDDPDSIGKAASLGCLRLRNEDVEKLAEWVAAGMEIHIID